MQTISIYIERHVATIFNILTFRYMCLMLYRILKRYIYLNILRNNYGRVRQIMKYSQIEM